MLNLSPLLFSADDESCFHRQLDLVPEQRRRISEARRAIRTCLRAGIPRVLKENGYPDDPPVPRFFTQGSWSYKTLNAPAQRPQQADMDDGCYLPLSFVSQTSRPSLAAEVFFSTAEEALKPLVNEMSWALDTSKPMCVRVILDPAAHVDVPLYAIPDEEFETLAKASMELYGYDSLMEALDRAERDDWTALPSDKVLLAHRKSGWISSDPRLVKDWFLSEVAVKGEQLRRVVRYLKAYRDWKWAEAGPASILLMAAAVPVFEKRHCRDDLALLEVVSEIPKQLRAGVNNPTDESESLTGRLGADGVEEAAQKFEELEGILQEAIYASSSLQACARMRKEFGPRFPNEPERIKVVSVAATITATPATAGPSELIGRTKAG